MFLRLLVMAIAGDPLQAQDQVILRGRVTSDRGQPLVGATVAIANTNWGASTGNDGTYRITVGASSAKGQSVTLTARAVGYRPWSVPVELTLGVQVHDFALVSDPLRLDEVVVTGTSSATSSKRLTFSVGRVSEAELQQAPAVSALGALQGKVAGVQVLLGNGAPGRAPQIRLRGATSITGTSDPLVIIDGTITRFSLADIASEDIERVEVIKGAAASSMYGSDAANGVIQVFTKRGANLADGRIQVTARGEFGRSSVPGDFSLTQHHAYILRPNGAFYRRADSSRVLPSACTAADAASLGAPCPTRMDALGRVVAVNVQDGRYPRYAGGRDKLLEPGAYFTQFVSIGQRRGGTSFNASFQNTRNEGSVFSLAGFRRQNYRINIDQVLSDRIDVGLNAFYGRSNNDEPQGNGELGPFNEIALLEPHIDPTAGCTGSGDRVVCPPTVDIGSQRIGSNPDGSPYNAFIRDKRTNAANPLYSLYAIQQDRRRGRFTGGGRLRWRPVSWLAAEGSYHFDQSSQEFSYREPVALYRANGSPSNGEFRRQSVNDHASNLGVQVTGTWHLNGRGLLRNLGLTAKGAYLYEDQANRLLEASAKSFIVNRVPEFPGTDPTSHRVSSRTEQIRNRNVFGVTTLDFDGKVMLDGLVRRDGSSLFGPQARFSTYWRASGAVRLPQLLGFEDRVDELRIRASHGTAGLRPQFAAQYEVLTPDGGSFNKQQLGNRNLRPARSRETEVGANLELLGGRLTVEYNFSDKHTTDQILNVPLLATTGWASQWQNLGALNSKSHEIAIGAQPIETRSMAVQLTLTGDRIREYITDWPLPDEGFGPIQGFSPFRFADGVRLGLMRGQRWVKRLADLYLDPAKAAASDPGEAWAADSVVVNADGYLVRRSTRGTNAERPIARVECTATDATGACAATTTTFDLGVSAPDFRIGLNTNLVFRRFVVTGLLDWSHGGQIYNGTAHGSVQDCVASLCDQSSKPADQRIAEGFYLAGLSNGTNANEAFVEDASFLKLRELSVNYTFNKSELGKLGLDRWLGEVRVGMIARNVITWSRYSGRDPDVAPIAEINGQPSGFRTRMDWFSYPQFRTITASIEIAF
ncbi:MAG: SusC/RagA family TonB-linked outer membrane protein [Gemmatimonadales bacterium]